jgi:hypothetical protein
MRVVGGNIYIAGVLKDVLNHLLCGIVEDEVGFILANAVDQAIMFHLTQRVWLPSPLHVGATPGSSA